MSPYSVWWNDKNLGDTESVPALREYTNEEGEGVGKEKEKQMNLNHSSKSNQGGDDDHWQDVGRGESSVDPDDPEFLSPTLPLSRFVWTSKDNNRFTVRLPEKGQQALISTLTLALWDTGEDYEEGQRQGQRGASGPGQTDGFAEGGWIGGGTEQGGGGENTPISRSATPTRHHRPTALYSGSVRLPFASLLHLRDGVVTLPFLPPGSDPFLATRSQVSTMNPIA